MPLWAPFLHQYIITRNLENLSEPFYLIGVYVALSDLYLCQGAAGNVTPKHLKSCGDLLLCELSFLTEKLYFLSYLFFISFVHNDNLDLHLFECNYTISLLVTQDFMCAKTEFFSVTTPKNGCGKQ